MTELIEQNRQIITKGIELLAKDIKKIDAALIKEASQINSSGNISPKTIEKMSKLNTDREKLLHTQTAFYAILGQWKNS